MEMLTTPVLCLSALYHRGRAPPLPGDLHTVIPKQKPKPSHFPPPATQLYIPALGYRSGLLPHKHIWLLYGTNLTITADWLRK